PVRSPQREVWDRVAAPPEVCGVPAEEVLFPVREKVGVIGGAPAARDRIAFEVDINAALRGLFQQLRVSGQGILIGARDRLVGGSLRGSPQRGSRNQENYKKRDSHYRDDVCF